MILDAVLIGLVVWSEHLSSLLAHCVFLCAKAPRFCFRETSSQFCVSGRTDATHKVQDLGSPLATLIRSELGMWPNLGH